MLDALHAAASGMRGHQLQIDTIAHNLANVNTVGFRRGITSFAEVTAALAAGTAAESANGFAPASLRGAGVFGTVALSALAGELQQTGEMLDVAIDGLGFIEVVRGDGTPAYTRAGKLRIGDDGVLMTADGSPLAAQLEISPDTRQLNILPDGRVMAVVEEGESAIDVGQIELVTFANPSALVAAGANLYVAPPAAGEAQVAAPGEMGIGSLRQGYLESSNVRLSDELVTMMLAQRAFELNARVIQAADQMLSITNSLYR